MQNDGEALYPFLHGRHAESWVANGGGDPARAGSPQSPGTLAWNGAYGHHWFIDPAEGLSVLALTNTTFEGMAGPFTSEVRNAVYGRAG